MDGRVQMPQRNRVAIALSNHAEPTTLRCWKENPLIAAWFSSMKNAETLSTAKRIPSHRSSFSSLRSSFRQKLSCSVSRVGPWTLHDIHETSSR
jgi:hypothetical protein